MSTELDKLAFEWEKAKEQENLGNEWRRRVEEQIITLVGVLDEGGETHDTDYYKIRVEGKLTRKLDEKVWEEVVKAKIPLTISPVRYKPELSITALKQLREENPAVYAAMLEAIETKPAKTYIKIERRAK